MKLKEIMTRQVEVIRPEAPIEEAAAKMRDLNIGPLPVCDGDRLVGMLTDRDITVRATAVGSGPQTRVADVMSPEVIFCFEDQDVKQAAQVMEENQIRRLPVLSRDKRLVGIVSLADLAVDAGNEKLAGQTLQEISRPARPER